MLIQLFHPPKPPAVRQEDVSVTHVFMNEEPRFKPDRVYARRTAEQALVRLWARREAEKIRRKMKRRQNT